jgi:hypothetical protein
MQAARPNSGVTVPFVGVDAVELKYRFGSVKTRVGKGD